MSLRIVVILFYEIASVASLPRNDKKGKLLAMTKKGSSSNDKKGNLPRNDKKENLYNKTRKKQKKV